MIYWHGDQMVFIIDPRLAHADYMHWPTMHMHAWRFARRVGSDMRAIYARTDNSGTIIGWIV